MGIFGGLVNTWKNGYQFGDLTKTLLYDLNPIAWAGDALTQKLRGDDDFDMFENNPNWTPSAEDPIEQGIVNSWNKLTGNAHLTPEAQHAEEREDTVNQRTAQDMMLAGLSKFGLSGVSAGSSSHANGLTMLDMIGKAQQIQAQAMSLKEMKYNLGVSKRLGIRTGDKNSLGQLTSIAKALFGLDLTDIPEEGIVPYLVTKVKEGFSSGNGSTGGAFADYGGAVASSGARATSSADASKVPESPFIPKGITQASDVKSKFVGILSKSTNGFTSDISGSKLKSVMDASVNELMSLGYGWTSAATMVNSWVKSHFRNYTNMDYNLYITKQKIDNGSGSSFSGGGQGGGGGSAGSSGSSKGGGGGSTW